MPKWFYTLFLILVSHTVSHGAQVTLNWSGLPKAPTTYKIYSSETSGTYDYTKPVAEYSGTLSKGIIEGLTNGKTYYLIARGNTATDETTSSTEVSVVASDSNTAQSVSVKFVNSWYNRKVYEYYGTTDKKVTVSWLPAANAETYEVRLVNLDKSSEVILSSGKVATNSVTFSLPKTGHYAVKVRSCKSNYTECSDWSYSTYKSDSIVDNVGTGWCIFGTVATPGSITLQ